jgi:hypothetical protein
VPGSCLELQGSEPPGFQVWDLLRGPGREREREKKDCLLFSTVHKFSLCSEVFSWVLAPSLCK